MNRNSNPKSIQAILAKALDDKKAISDCIQKGEDLKKLANDRKIKFATPL